MFIDTPFMIVREGRQTKCPSADEWKTKVQHKYRMKYYLAVKKSEICREMGGPREDYSEGGNPDPETQTPHALCHLQLLDLNLQM